MVYIRYISCVHSVYDFHSTVCKCCLVKVHISVIQGQINLRLRERWQHVHFPRMHCQCQLKIAE